MLFLPPDIRAERVILNKWSSDSWYGSIKNTLQRLWMSSGTSTASSLCCCDLYLFRKVIWTPASPAGSWAAVVLSNSALWLYILFLNTSRRQSGDSNQWLSGPYVSHLEYFQFAPKCPCSVITCSSRKQRETHLRLSERVCLCRETQQLTSQLHYDTLNTSLVLLFYFYPSVSSVG